MKIYDFFPLQKFLVKSLIHWKFGIKLLQWINDLLMNEFMHKWSINLFLLEKLYLFIRFQFMSHHVVCPKSVSLFVTSKIILYTIVWCDVQNDLF